MRINRKSGRYRLDEAAFGQVLEKLARGGVELDPGAIGAFISDP